MPNSGLSLVRKVGCKPAGISQESWVLLGGSVAPLAGCGLGSCP